MSTRLPGIKSLRIKKHPEDPNKWSEDQKLLWTNVFQTGETSNLKENINRDIFSFLLEKISPFIFKKPAFMVPETGEVCTQLTLTIYSMAHGCTFLIPLLNPSLMFLYIKVLVLKNLRNYN